MKNSIHNITNEERAVARIYRANVNKSASTETAVERFLGVADTQASWMYQWLEATGQLEEIPERFRTYLDYGQLATDSRLNGEFYFVEHGGRVWVFLTH
ncbi:MAG: hypothetical protein A3E23_07790 [Burkholderiales bacterium RIFCSPHIGHO2_12_FULL_65_48]|nr:MAG: hypothetical protein A3C40_02700 [Burkholderiales bacterium RIFCSPHIGHO2_02_FULL_64_19]OGB25061.1 MAG: hypothetical protein A3E23_07790 [Burkholderiales bacterium RIFCSPHIGHO2_12_FULL_65_48]OGB53733.1 MAG: hypothetical protein A3F71_09930 [Burkholderiales bacterium RIFCSPLOWO2_12_FULL_64_33]